jgi:hypothetical protein
VYGLDLRDLAGLEAFCALLLREYPRLDVLINNACQTVRRPAAYYAHMMPAERAALAALPAPLAPLLARDAARVGGCEAERFVEQAADPADPAIGPSGNGQVGREDGAVELEVPADPGRRTRGVDGLRESQGIEFGGRGDQNPIARREGGDRGSKIGGEGGHAPTALPAP